MSGLAHWKFGNVDWKVVAKIGVPGAVGAFVGATVLSSLSTEVAAPVMSLILLTLGVYILRPVHPPRHRPAAPRQADAQALPRPARPGRRLRRRHRRRRLGPGRHPGDPGQRPHGAAQGHRLDRHRRSSSSPWPRASASWSRSARRASTRSGSPGLLAGGLVAAPIAAWLVRHIPPRMLGSLVGGMIVLTNTRTLLSSDWIDAARPRSRYADLRRALRGLGRRRRPLLPPVPQGPGAGVRRRRSPPRPRSRRTWRPTSTPTAAAAGERGPGRPAERPAD